MLNVKMDKKLRETFVFFISRYNYIPRFRIERGYFRFNDRLTKPVMPSSLGIVISTNVRFYVTISLLRDSRQFPDDAITSRVAR